MVRSRTLPLIRTSWLINVMFLLLYPIYSIPLNLSIHPNPTVLRTLQPQHTYSGQPGLCSSSTAGQYPGSVPSPCASLDSNNRVIISFTILFLYPKATHHPLCQPTHIKCHYNRSLIYNTWTQNILPVRTPHLTTHTNTKHIACQNTSLNNTYRHKTYCQSEHLTQQHIQTQNTHLPTYINTKRIVRQDISLTNTHKHNTHRPPGHITH